MPSEISSTDDDHQDTTNATTIRCNSGLHHHGDQHSKNKALFTAKGTIFNIHMGGNKIFSGFERWDIGYGMQDKVCV